MTTSPTVCPHCQIAVPARDLRCPGCQAPMLFGLVAAPVRDRALEERAAALLSAVAGGPAPASARRRLREGLPLIVGLSRHATEELQGRLVDLGLVPRIGPAPRGTAPLGPEPAATGLGWRLGAALAVPVAALLLFKALEPAAPPSPPATAAATPDPLAAARRGEPVIRLSAGFERERGGRLLLVLVARAVSAAALPDGDLALRLRDETGRVLWSGTLPERLAVDRVLPASGGPIRERSLTFRQVLVGTPLSGGQRVTLEADWRGWRAEPLRLEVPPLPARR